MPIGSKSYYDSLDMAENNQEPRPLLFRRGDAKARSNQSSPASKPKSAPTKAPQADVSADAGFDMRSPESALNALQIEAVVCQILELTQRTGMVLQRAEEMAGRAEEMFAAACESAQRAEAAALRAEAAVARLELDEVDDDGGEDPGDRNNELELVAQITERLRNGLQQIDGLSNKYVTQEAETEVDPSANATMTSETSTEYVAPFLNEPAFSEPTLSLVDSSTPSVEPLEKTAEFSRESLGYGLNGRSSFARTPNAPIESDALAHSLVSVCHDTGMPRVSPYIIQLPASGESESYFAPIGQVANSHEGAVNIAI